MRKNRTSGKKGFALVELLIVIAILGILAGVGTTAVVSYQRSMEQLEMDGVAREVFIAAQNHLTLASSQGMLTDDRDYGAQDPTDDDLYYLVVPGDADVSGSVLSLMLPPLSVDELVRSDGSYVISYHRSTATLLDVLYSGNDSRHPFSFAGLTGAEAAGLIAACRGDENRAARKSYGGSKAVIGWYGGEDTSVELPDDALNILDFEIFNENTLYAVIPDPNAGDDDACLSLSVRGADSGAEQVYLLVDSGVPCSSYANVSWSGSTATVVLDDVLTVGFHFAELFPGFTPGEDLELTLSVFSRTKVVTIPPAIGPKTENSLFASVNGASAEITHCRHLENLDENVSDFDADSVGVGVTGAKQTADLSWPDFIGTSGTVYLADGTPLNTGKYYPVCPPADFTYDGGIYGSGGSLTGTHSITGVDAESADAVNAGLFGTLTGGSVTNLELLDFRVSAVNGLAGALAGKLISAAAENVLARCSAAATYGSCNISSSNGGAGGLVGSMSGGSLLKCAAALPVSAKTAAGGLVGSLAGSAALSQSYSAGRTNNGAYSSTSWNVSGAAAGGLVGSSESTASIERCYSTCSVSGTSTAGGLVGSAAGTIKKSYAVGLIGGSASAKGAFAGSWSDTTALSEADKNHYYKIVNETVTSTGATYLPAVPGESDENRVRALDKNASKYQDFVGDPGKWDTAAPFDGMLGSYYLGRTPLPGQKRMDSTITAAELVSVHYGDWPAPELRVLN